MNCHSQKMKESYSSAHDRITSTSPFSNKQNLKKQTNKKNCTKICKMSVSDIGEKEAENCDP